MNELNFKKILVKYGIAEGFIDNLKSHYDRMNNDKRKDQPGESIEMYKEYRDMCERFTTQLMGQLDKVR